MFAYGGVYICVYVGVNMCARVYMVYIHVRYIHECVYTCLCAHLCVCVVCVCVYMCVISVYMVDACLHACTYLNVCVCMHVYAYVYTHMCVSVYMHICVYVCTCACACVQNNWLLRPPFSSFPTRGKIKWTLMSLLGPRSYNPPGECCVLHPYSPFLLWRLCQLNKKQIHSAHAKIKKQRKGFFSYS